jgi:acetolactate synthase-1/2/3 large subunit
MTEPFERTGAQILCEALIRADVQLMFGIPGGAIMPFYHAMWEYRPAPDRRGLRHVLCRHEQGAGHAAEGYARVTGKVGVCVGTSGPGATNLVTPIADAHMDSVPLLAITGQVSAALLGTDAFQETDITGITIPITKHNYLITNPNDIPRVIAEAVHIATTGRPGPVLVDITKDAQLARATPDWDVTVNLPGYVLPPAPDSRLVRQAAALIANAQRPLVIAGQGVILSGATRELESLGIPIVTTLHGLGATRLSLGMAGMHGYAHVNRAIQRCDLLIGVGLRFDDRVTGKVARFAPNAKIIHIDADRAELGKLVRTDVAIHSDARAALRALLAALENIVSQKTHKSLSHTKSHPLSHTKCDLAKVASNETRNSWLEQIAALRAAHQRAPNDDHFALPPSAVYAALDRVVTDKTRIVTDVGQHQMWAAQQLTWRSPRTHITSGGAGTMGFAIPAALGVALACPDETIWVICGDGGFQMTNQEMATISQENIKNIKIIIVNNGYLGMVRQWQQLFEASRYSETRLSAPDFARLAEAHGWWARTVTDRVDIAAALRAALEHDGPALIDAQVEREANVWPIVPAGKSLDEMLLA